MTTMADYDTFPPSNDTTIYTVSQAPSFDIVFEAISTALFGALLLAHTGLGAYLVYSAPTQWRSLQRWPLYCMLLVYVAITCVCESVALTYTVETRAGYAKTSVYLVYIFFWHASNASFLVLLLALSSGYCITRGSLEGHEPKVIVIPLIVFIAGVASDFTFVYVKSTQQLSTAADRYDIVQMTAWESAVWFIGTLANIMCFILAWIYVFDSTQLEIKALDDAQAALTGRQQLDQAQDLDPYDAAAVRRQRDHAERDSDDEDNVRRIGNRANGAGTAAGGGGGGGGGGAVQSRPLSATSQLVSLLYNVDNSAAGINKETVADHMEYNARKQLLSRFYFGVCGYLVVSIMVVILPAFFNADLQNSIVVLQFLFKYIFTLLLAWVFKPGKDSPYLQVGASENDAENLGVAGLDTELAVTEFQDPRTSGAGSLARPAAASSQQPRFPARGAGSSQAASPHLPVSMAATSGLAPPPAKSKPNFSSIARGDPGQQKKSQFTLEEYE